MVTSVTQVPSHSVTPATSEQRSRDPALAWVTFGALSIATWIFTLARAIPLRDGDRGIFVSMAERLAAGDILYVNVWDNKEPLFFLTLSLGRLFSPGMDVVIEVAWIAIAAVSSFFIARSAAATPFIPAAAGFVATPLIITGASYAAGFSHLPATSVFLAMAALGMSRRWFLAGVLLPVLGLYKIITVPMGLAVLAVALVTLGGRRELLPSVLGALISSTALIALLALRGEWIGFLELVWSNIGYSQQQISDAYQVPIWAHVEPVMVPGAVITVTASALTLLIVRCPRGSALRPVKLMTAWSLAAALGITALTGLWSHHAQLFYGPAVLAAVLLAVSLHHENRSWPTYLSATLLAAIVLSGGLSLRAMVDSGLSAPTRWNDLFRLSQEAADIRKFDSDASYMRLGSNTDNSHAYGLRDYDFACYQFVQYYYDMPATLEYIPGCLPQADVVIVDESLTERSGANMWNEFVRESERVLAESFTCKETSYGRLCTRAT